ncbi:hypothetical protein KC460_00080 [Candidatus Dependentiae bacterium]|nr:hypothetical protein [Candidatus Dependentiae bacterium]
MKNICKVILVALSVALTVSSTSCVHWNWQWGKGTDGIKHEKMIIRKRVGQEVEIEVKRGKRGYSWRMVREPNPTILKFDEKDTPRSKRARSEYEWEYDAVEPGTTWVVLEQMDENNKVIARREYKIVISPRKGGGMKATEIPQKTNKAQYGIQKIR